MKHLRKLERNNTTDCLWPYILRILSDKPTHAYAIRKAVNERFGFMPGAVTAYRVLYDLTKRGLVKKTPAGRRKIYTITQKGRTGLRRAVDFYRSRAKLLG